MQSRAVLSVSAKTFSTMSAWSESSSPASWVSSTRIRNSSTVWISPSSPVGLVAEPPQEPRTRTVHQADERAGDAAEEPPPVGPPTAPRSSLSCSAASFGICSPKTTCMYVISASVITIDSDSRPLPGQPFEQRVQQPVNRRFADEAQGEAGDRNSELTRGDAAVQIGDRSKERHGPGLASGSPVLRRACGATRDQGELRRDEVPVDGNEYRNRDQPDNEFGCIHSPPASAKRMRGEPAWIGR